jgi:predicted HTH domain antitoxin
MNIIFELHDLFKKTRKEIAIKLFEWKKISSGIAAILAGMERVQFLLELHRYNIPMIDLDDDEILQDIKNA